MKPLKEILKEAESKHIAVGHFNVSDSATFNAIFFAAQSVNLPVMIGVSEGERDFIGVRQVAALVKSIREAYDFPIYLNADHTHSLEKAKEAAEAGFDEILFDGSKLPFEENISQTKKAVELVKSINPAALVEGEIGYIGSSSAILKEIPKGAALTKESLTTKEEALQFVKETKVDILAPAVGNMHGLLASMVSGEVQKHLDISRIKELKDAVNMPMTLHGGSGTADKDFKEAIKAGITIVHVNTELRLAWRKGIEEGLKNQDEIAPYKLLLPALEKIKSLVASRLLLFGK